MTLLCLIPAWNEAERIGQVLAAVAGHPLLGRVLVIDDGSSDGTDEVARRYGVDVLRSPGNLGKTRALAFGLGQIAGQGSHVLLLDADLAGLTADDITRLARPVIEGRADASLSLRGNAPLIWRLLGVDYITGERVLPLNWLCPQIEKLTGLPRFGFEVFLNSLLLERGAQIAVVEWPGVESPSKARKCGNLRIGLRADLAMMRDIIATIGWRDCLQQIFGLRRSRIPTRAPASDEIIAPV